jgi:hypothetical protein
MLKFKKLFLITLSIFVILLSGQSIFTSIFASDGIEDLEHKLTSILFVDSLLTREEILDIIADYAEIEGIPFEESLTIFYEQEENQSVFAANKITMSKLNCSSLVWRAYKHVNIDLDSNGGPGVYPADIRNSRFTSTYERK